jgi:hypothetical protein
MDDDKKNDNQKCLKMINKLPQELIKIIFEYIRPIVLVTLNKSYYVIYHPSIKKYLCNVKHQYDNYIRDIIRRDNNYVFNQVLQENYRHWLHFHNYCYKDKIYINYLYFLLDYCMLYESNKCKQMIQSAIYDSNGISKNQHKKNLVKIIKRKWMN